MIAKKLFNLYADYFKALNQLQARVLVCYTAKDFLAKNFSYERKIYQARMRLFFIMKKIRVIVEQEKVSHLSELENIYEIIFSLNTLKLRVSDVSVFEICQAEIAALTEYLAAVLQQMVVFFLRQGQQERKLFIDGMAKKISQFSHKVGEFEEVYRTTLQVVTPDPIFFLFFLQDLIALREKLESFFLGFFNDGSF